MPRDVILTIVSTSFSWLSASATVHCFWTFFRDRENYNAGPFPWRRSGPFTERGLGWRNIIYYILVWTGIAYCIYHGAVATLQWMPENWRANSEYGEMSLRQGLGFMIAFYGSMLLLSEMARNAPAPSKRR